MTEAVFLDAEECRPLILPAYKNPEIIKDTLLEGCKKVIEKGAHSVIFASGGIGNMATGCGIHKVPKYDAPVYDPITCGAKMLEYRIYLQKQLGIPPTSRAGSYRLFPEKHWNSVMETFDFHR